MSKISNATIGKSDTGGRAGGRATREQILELLKRRGAQSAGALGQALKVTAMAARLHLFELEEEGLVESFAEAKGRGRPTKFWKLTQASARIFPDAHQSLAVEMIKSVEELFGVEGLAKVVKKHGNMQRRVYGEKLSGATTLGERVKRLAKARTGEGYMAEAKRDGRDWLLIENHCPICSAAKSCTGLCAGELKVFSDVLGKDVRVEREEHILSGARRCAYRVRAK
ncbi:helix-turn-helix transcriptional regulator [Hyphococcus sp.]|uniref:helix-turn-helix transcriptional regulator n=1 Tax=Hyphococcus sp. TaxID=2038636 RepID=UPI003CCBE454